MKKIIVLLLLLSVFSIGKTDVSAALVDRSYKYDGVHKHVRLDGISYKYINEYTSISEWPTVAYLSKAKVFRNSDGKSEYKESRMGYWVKADLTVDWKKKGARYYH